MGKHAGKNPEKNKESTKTKLKLIKKQRKQKQKEKRARLVVRNLPFNVTEENLREHFTKIGELEDVQLLKKEDGHLVGCAFVQFKLVQKAAKAKHHLNGKPFLGRDIKVEFALAKDKYKTENEVKVKQENEIAIKEEPIENPETDEIKNESEDHTNDHDNDEVVSEEEVAEDNDTSSDEEKDSQTEDEVEELEEKTKPKFESNDVNEGKTIFIKNVPFSATNNDLKECMLQFGPIYYALICMDKFTEHSKGTAFVKFCNVEDSEKALAAGTELTLLGNVLDCHKALGRNEMQQKLNAKQEEKKAPRDSRNLYLVKEGVILAGSKAAEGVSATDMGKRLQLEQYKTQMLRNLNMYVARDRFVIHNLPPSWDDNKLRMLIKNNSPKNSIIREARIMRDLKNVDANGVGKSKEFGFVAFARHEDALATLRALNNNPNIFSANKRPIVAFSIENKTMVKAKQKRLEKSRQKNPKSKNYDPNVVKVDEEKRQKRIAAETGNDANFAGVSAKPGVQKMRSRYNLKTQAKLHHENLKKQKKKAKFVKKQESIKQPRQKINKKKENDNFSKLVSDYKKKLQGPPDARKSKWYE